MVKKVFLIVICVILGLYIIVGAANAAYGSNLRPRTAWETMEELANIFDGANPFPDFPEYPDDETFDESGEQTNSGFFRNAGRFFNYVGQIFVFLGKVIVWVLDELKLCLKVIALFLPERGVTII